MSSSNCFFLTCIQISQEAGWVVWYSHLFKNFPQFVVIHTVKVFDVVSKAEVDVLLEFSCFFCDPVDVGNLIPGSSAFSKSSLNIWKFGQLSCFFLHTWLVHRPFLRCLRNFFLSWIPSQRPAGTCPHLLWGGAPSLFDPQEAWLHMCRQGGLSLTSEWAPYLFALAELSFRH